MITDASALLAVVLDEPDGRRYAEVIAAAPRAREARPLYGHTRLNFADCMVYGVAKVEREPLLYKGSDFSQTDIEPALKD